MDASLIQPDTRPRFDVSASIDDRLVYASGTLVLPRPGRAALLISVAPGVSYPINLSFQEASGIEPKALVTASDDGIDVALVNWDAGSLATKKPLVVGLYDDHQVLLALSVHSIGADKESSSRIISYSFLRGELEPIPSALS